MADNERKVTLLLKRGLKKDLPRLLEGEMGLATDTKELFVGSATGNVKLAGQDSVDSVLKGLQAATGLTENKFSYSYFPNGDVQTITEKDKNNVVVSTTTFAYKSNGDVDTSTLVKDGTTIVTQYVYDSNGNLTDTINTRAGS